MRQCPNCGATIKQDSRFCTSCGVQLPDSNKLCPRCGKSRGLLGIGFDKETGRCNKCEKQVSKAKRRFQPLFLKACEDDLLEEHEWAQFDRFCAENEMPLWNAPWGGSVQQKQVPGAHIRRGKCIADSPHLEVNN